MQQILETFTCHGRVTMNNTGMMLYVIVQTDILAVTSHIDGGADYFTMCTILPGGTAVPGKGRNYQRQSGNFYKSCAWLERKFYEA